MWKSWISGLFITGIAIVLLFPGCIFNPNIDAGRFVCTTDEDCPDNWVCYPSLNRCYKKDAENIPLPDAGGDPCPVNGQERSCYTGPIGTKNVGLCKAGLQSCKNGRWTPCEGQVTPKQDDPCDGQDNNCNGIIDDGCPCNNGQRRSCFSGPPSLANKGACKKGLQTCVNQQWGPCEGQVLPTQEICDGADNDCNGKVDDAIASKRCYTGPPSTLGQGRCVAGQAFCKNGKFGDCVGQVTPRDEVCDNKTDDDCDGLVDENCGCKAGDIQVCYSGSDDTRGKGECKAGTQRCQSNGTWGKCENQILPTKEVCDGLDNNCDGKTDEGLATRPCYSGTAGTSGTGPCKDGIQACVNGTWGLCRGEVTPKAEICDKQDNDCDGTVDEGCECIQNDTRTCYSGPGGTAGRGLCKSGTQTCSGGKWGACVGQVLPAKETCDGKDNDCDGSIDGYSRSCFSGDPAKQGKGICRAGAQTCTNGKWSTCLGEILPSKESCDGIDNDCDGQIDGMSRDCYNNAKGCKADAQGNYNCTGTCAPGKQVCAKGAWSVCKGEVTPQQEVCDGKDNDCDGKIDGYTEVCYTGKDNGCLPDGKGGFFCKGLCASGKRSCTAGKLSTCTGEVIAAKEICDGKDNNCDGQVDEGCNCLNNQQRACYTGPAKTEKVGVCKGGTQTCTNGQWGTCVGQIVPTAEICNGKDDDCDGSVDEQVTRSCFTGPASSANKGLCKSGTQTCTAGKWGTCVGQVLPAKETCDGKDNDCDGKTDNNLTAPACTKQKGVCKGAVKRCGGTQGWLKCAATEYGKDYQLLETNCDGKDNDCDGSIDGSKACGFCIQSTKAAQFVSKLPKSCLATDSCFDKCLWFQGNTYYCRNTAGKGFRYVTYNDWILSCNAPKACTTSLCSTTSYFCDGAAWRKGTKPGTNDDFCDGLDNNCNGTIDENCTCQSICTANKHCKGSCKRCVKLPGSPFPRCVP